mmetsp:Transcript_36943/g.27314  ORF Transcript_36943/g.27314 Transcript_36943/m.27314 type:complete len:80 (-) Transcript_36943:17-256(-)|eukprot:CAMPEP_0202965636 /NCGR_PEP_ID=MMETSP1396-20130829/9543_1 /ASSEMBLY_ACC=CAM_ASM_000872 /TAXON_ID= /ORGANISM="Pseudokeronopsis sp., Strain Brazil" /LENGTH=79 /DNA_ID=CAMNT_0049688413 /DNA_START=552 /DNA_END=791 /DNA_ORIENTATION=-
MNELVLNEAQRQDLATKYIEVFKIEENPYYLEEEWEACKMEQKPYVEGRPMSYKVSAINSEFNLFDPILLALRDHLRNG